MARFAHETAKCASAGSEVAGASESSKSTLLPCAPSRGFASRGGGGCGCPPSPRGAVAGVALPRVGLASVLGVRKPRDRAEDRHNPWARPCTAPHTRPRVGANTRPRSTTVSRVRWTRCQPLACNAKRALHDSKAQRRPRSLSRSRADEMDCSPAIGQRSYAQPLVPAAPAPSAPSCISSSPHSADCFPEVRSPCSS